VRVQRRDLDSAPESAPATTCRGMRTALEIVGNVITRWRTWHCHKRTCSYCQSPAYREARRWRRQGVPIGADMMEAARAAVVHRLRERGLVCLVTVNDSRQFKSLRRAVRRQLTADHMTWWGEGPWTLALPSGYREFTVARVPEAVVCDLDGPDGSKILSGMNMARVGRLLQGEWAGQAVVRDSGGRVLATNPQEYPPVHMAKGEPPKPDTDPGPPPEVAPQSAALADALERVRRLQDLVGAGVDLHPELVGKTQHEDQWKAGGFRFAYDTPHVSIRPSAFTRDPESIIDGGHIDMVPLKKEAHVTEDRLRQILREELQLALQPLLDQLRRGEISADEFERRSRTVLDSRKVQ
jgi:hypothetical protein